MGTGPRPADDLVEVAARSTMVLPFKLFICRRVHAFGRKGAPGLVPLLGVSPDNYGTIRYWFMAFDILMRFPFSRANVLAIVYCVLRGCCASMLYRFMIFLCFTYEKGSQKGEVK